MLQFNLPVVINKRTTGPSSSYRDFYIGRGSPLGNPYTHLPSSVPTLAKHRVGSRREAIERFGLDLVRDPERLTIIARMFGNVDRLVCYCKPQPCHGDVIVCVMGRIASKQYTDFRSKAVQEDLLANLREKLPVVFLHDEQSLFQ